MSFLDAVEIYFRGERTMGYALIPIGIAVAAIGVYFAFVYGGGLGKALGIPLVVAGIGAGIGGPFLAKTVNARQAKLGDAVEKGDAEALDAERERIAGVNSNWKTLKGAWSALTIAGLLLLLLVKRDWVSGLALALICLCAFALVVDTVAEKRARIYAERIAEVP